MATRPSLDAAPSSTFSKPDKAIRPRVEVADARLASAVTSVDVFEKNKTLFQETSKEEHKIILSGTGIIKINNVDTHSEEASHGKAQRPFTGS
ncbi:hypothetical protein MHUMG1_08331 [Metarhizium humberi]|uniref:Uncharacterized protein n=1 Tax=Metarhizium humberi TaxID=2596975 RepID=A0A9P8M567_9HYPO|nr:hypothetical protein MHUMG1_08331 [Metarhizium humberi]